MTDSYAFQGWDAGTTYAAGAFVEYSNRIYRSLKAANTNHVPTEQASTWWSLYVDPITQVYYALWNMLESHAPFAAMVRVGNRVKFADDNRDPIKAQVQTADLPEVRVVPTGGSAHPHCTSSSSKLVKGFSVQIVTGDRRVTAALFPVEWEVYRALVNWYATLAALTWKNQTYVKMLRSQSIGEGLASKDENRGIAGWVTVWKVDVEMYFATAQLTGD